MPELPDIEAYLEALKPRVVGRLLIQVRVARPFLLRTVKPPLSAVAGGRVAAVSRVGKRIVLEIDAASGGPDALPETRGPDASAPAASRGGPSPEPFFLVIHLMVAGRLHWRAPGAAIPRGSGQAAFDFPTGTLLLTEAGSKRRASLHLVRGWEDLARLAPGGAEVADLSVEEFAALLGRENHTLKRALTDPRLLSGIGNAYSDEILHRARLSPLKQTKTLTVAEFGRLHAAAAAVLGEWTTRLKEEAREAFPERVTAFRPGMAVHGRYGLPCPVCGTSIARIVCADNECDYCPGCQTGGRVLADRALSRLLKDDWPGTRG
jgi:formamidopyrimidine-DNA glycosylase